MKKDEKMLELIADIELEKQKLKKYRENNKNLKIATDYCDTQTLALNKIIFMIELNYLIIN